MTRVHLEILQDDAVQHRVAVPSGGLTIGRAPTADLVLADPGVSRSHCVVWVADGQAWLRDLGSRNGTWVGPARLDGALPIDDRDALRIGDRVQARVVGAPPVPDRGAIAGALLIEDEASGVRVAVPAPPFTVGDGGDDAVRLWGAPAGLVEVADLQGDALVLTDGSRWRAGARLDAGGRSLRLVRVAGALAATVGPESDLPAVHVEVTLEGAAGAEAWVSTLPDGAPVLVASGNRAVLLYLLARALQRDRDGGVDADAAGWSSDDDLGVGIWGRAWAQQDVNNLHVLIYRLRKGLQTEGFDSALVEKRRKATRLQALRVTVR